MMKQHFACWSFVCRKESCDWVFIKFWKGYVMITRKTLEDCSNLCLELWNRNRESSSAVCNNSATWFTNICCASWFQHTPTCAHTHTTILRPSSILSGTIRVSQLQKGKTNLDLLEQGIVSGSGISWAAPWPRHVTMPASHHSVFCRPDALPATQPTASKHWRHSWFQHRLFINSGQFGCWFFLLHRGNPWVAFS